MTKDEATKKIRKYFKKWSWIVERWGWKFSMNTCDGSEHMPPDADNDAAAVAFYRWNYLEGEIYFNLRKVEKMDDEEIEELVIHELCHFLLAPMEADKRNAEISVTMVARTLKGLSGKALALDP